MRAALYVDGFNLYHAVDDLNQPFLKWVSLWKLGQRILLDRSEMLVKVVYCTALKPGDPEKNKRHNEYMTALKHSGVSVVPGHFIHDTVDCRGCGREWSSPNEKESDVNLALSLFDDAYQDVYDVAYLLTADSDQGATARLFKERFPGKKLVSAVPPRREVSRAIKTHTPHKVKIHESYLEQCLLPPSVMEYGDDGKMRLVYRRPTEYAPPEGWVPPGQRPKKAKA